MKEKNSDSANMMEEQPADARAMIELATKLRQAGHYSESLRQCEQALLLDPLNPAAIMCKVDALSALHRRDEALDCCQRASEILPDNKNLKLKVGTLLRMRSPQESVIHFRAMAEAYPEDARVMIELATSLRLAGQHGESLHQCEQLLARHPLNPAAIMLKVDALSAAHRQEEALAYCRSVLEKLPETKSLKFKAGALLRIHNPQESVIHFRSMADAHPEDARVRVELATSLRLAGHYGESLSHCDQVLSRDPLNPAAIMCKVDALNAADRRAEAVEYCRAAARTLPGNLPLQFKAGVLLRMQDAREGVTHFRRMADAYPENTRVLIELATSLRQAGEHRESASIYRSIPAGTTERINALMGLIEIHSADEDFEAALALANQALAEFPDNETISYRRADILFHLGDTSERLAQLRSSLAKSPGSFRALRALSTALVQNGRIDEADTLAREFISHIDDTPDVLARKIELCLLIGQIRKALELAEAWLSEMPDSAEAMLALYQARISALDLTELDALEDRLLTLRPDSEALAIAMASRRMALWDYAAAIRVLDAFLDRLPAAKSVSAAFFDLLWRTQDQARYEAVLAARGREAPLLKLRFIDHLVNNGVTDRARAQLEDLENQIPSGMAPGQAAFWLMQIHRRYLTLGDDAATRIADRAKALSFLGPRERRYFSPDKAPEQSARPPRTYAPLRDALFGSGHAPRFLAPEQLAVAQLISPPSGQDYDAWIQKIMKAATISKHLSIGYFEHPEVFQGFDELVDFPDAAPLFEHARRKEAFLIASVHLGTCVSPWWLAQTFDHIRIVARSRLFSTPSRLSRQLMFVDGSGASGRELLTHIRNGGALGGTIDQALVASNKFASDQFSCPLSLFGLPPVRVPNLLPRLAWKYRLPSYWMDARLKNGRIRFKLARLPDVTEADDWTGWSTHWMSQCATHFEELLQSDPENLSIPNPLFEALAEGLNKQRRENTPPPLAEQ